ncbi:MAG: glycoside hydrolase family 127 protein, partial [Abditibacteriota bacterium]|nr:glycoside hydrolase family 127 protein [Abditibacteriota bacterium]
TETCAAIGLAMFAGRMQRIEARGKYGDVFERAFYNGVLSGMSADGKSFFYMNPLEVDPDFNDVNTSTLDKEWHPPTTRKECFDCSCCPPNIVRFIPSFANYMYTFDEDTLYVHQFAESEMNFEGMSVTMTTNYPADGTVKISCNTGGKRLAVRVPGWCRKFDINADYELKNGYAYIDNPSEVVVSFDMPVEVIKANRRVHDCAGRVAVTRGPVVYCAEGVDNGPDVKNIRIDINGSFETAPSEFLLPALKTTGYRDPASDELYMTADGKYEEVPLTLIPYFGFANRGETDMNVWLLTK